MKTYYKVVYVDDRGLMWSMSKGFLGDAGGELVLPYVLGRRTTPNVGGLLAFESQREAAGFAWVNSINFVTLAVVEGKGKKRPLSKWRSNLLGVKLGTWDAVWKPGRKCDKICQPWPEDTVALEWFETEKVVW